MDPILADAEQVARSMEPAALVVFLTAGAVIVVAELLGIIRKGKRGDTVSDIAWAVRDRLPRWAKIPALVAWTASLAWLGAHIAFGGN